MLARYSHTFNLNSIIDEWSVLRGQNNVMLFSCLTNN